MANATKEDLVEMRKEFERRIEEAESRNKLNIQLSRKMKITQEQQKYQDPASKRGVGFIIENSFDLMDLRQAAEPLVEEGENKQAVIKESATEEEKDAFILFCVQYIRRRELKDEKEIEDYQMANNSRYGWLVPKFYAQGDMFRGLDALDEVPEMLSTSEKISRFRQAETQAKFFTLDKAKSSKGGFNDFGSSSFNNPRFGGYPNAGVKRTRWDQATDFSFPPPTANTAAAATMTSGQGMQGNFIPGAAFMPPRAPVICFICNMPGHVKKDCPNRKQQQ